MNDPLSAAFWIPIGLATACGAVIGLERQLRGKPSGMRTSILICLGTSVFVTLGRSVTDPASADPTRVLGQIITGVGFLGAGVIFTRDDVVTGVTTAAVIWVTTAIGAAIGLGLHRQAVALTGTVVLLLVGLDLLERGFIALRRGQHDDAAVTATANERARTDAG